MKRTFNLIIIVSAITLFYQCNSADSNTQSQQDKLIVKEITLDLNSDNYTDTIILLEPETSGDPGVFKKIQIRGKNIIPFELKANYSWDSIPKYLRKRNDNKINCDLLFIKQNNKSSYILLNGWGYSTGQEDFALIGISENKCTLLTKENFNDVEEFEDLNKDGIIEIVLNPTWSEGIDYIDSLNASIASYSPYYVYSLTPNTFKFDSILTREYNQKNYAWAGLDNIDSVQVMWLRNENKYRIWKK
jgi:hypothetical protein